MPSRQMGMSVGARYAREQCVHQGCVEGPGSSPEILKGQSVQIIGTFMRLGYVITIPVWPCINNENAKTYFKAILSELLAF